MEFLCADCGYTYDDYIGCPYVDIPDPWGCHENYAVHGEQEFMKGIEPFGIEIDWRYQADMYRSGKYVDHILTALQKRGEIFDILDSFRTQEAQPGEREAYYPVRRLPCGPLQVRLRS